MRVVNRSLVLDILLLSIVVLSSVLVHYEGWRSPNLNNPDILPYYLGAETQLLTGKILDHGNLSNYHSFVPPGAVYWILLGASFMPDLRLFALPANLILSLFPVVLLYILVREVLGREMALVSGLVFAFSRLGYQTVWPIGHSLYLILILLFSMYWIRHRNPWAFFAVAVVAAFGAYDYLTILPCLLIPLVAWLLFRPPLRVLPLLASLVAGLLIWFPYLQFEAPRNFMDMGSILLLRHENNDLTLVTVNPTYCLAALPGEPQVRDGVYVPYLNSSQASRIVNSQPGLKPSLYYQACKVFLNLGSNFNEGYVHDGNLNADWVWRQSRFMDVGEGLFITPSPIVSVICWLFFMIGLFQSAAMLFPEEWIRPRLLSRWQAMPVWAATGIALVVGFSVFGVFTMLFRYAWIGKDHSFRLIATQADYFLPLVIGAAMIGFYLGLQPPRQEPRKVFFLFSLWIPWFLLIILAEPGVPERFYWLWPLQVAVAVMALYGYLRAWTSSRWTRWIVSAAAIVVIFPLPAYLPRIQDAMAHGYAGEDSEQVQVIDFIGQDVRKAGLSQISVGMSSWSANKTGTDNTLLWGGAWLDLLLQTRWHVENIDTNPEGIDQQDQWRIWTPEKLPCREEDAQILSWEKYQLVFQSGPYCVFKLKSESWE